jgi:hypothetical protein
MVNEQRDVPFIDPRAHRAQLAFVGALLIVAAATGSTIPLWIGAVADRGMVRPNPPLQDDCLVSLGSA